MSNNVHVEELNQHLYCPGVQAGLYGDTVEYLILRESWLLYFKYVDITNVTTTKFNIQPMAMLWELQPVSVDMSSQICSQTITQTHCMIHLQ